MGSTYQHARRLGAGADLTDGTDRFLVSDYSPGTGDVYGWRLKADGTRGAYIKLPADLMEVDVMSAPQPRPQPVRKYGYNIVGRVRALAARAEWAETIEQRQRSADALEAIHEILTREGLES